MPENQKTPMFSKTPVLVAVAVFCCMLWGSATPAIKTGYRLLEVEGVASIMLFAGLRFFLAGLLTIAIFSLAQRRFLFPRKENIKYVLHVSVFQTIVQYIFFYLGLHYTTGVKGTVASGSGAFFAVIIATLLYKQEKLTVKKIVACVAGFGGILLMNVNSLSAKGGGEDLMGVGFVLLSTIAASVSSVLMKRYSEHEYPVTLSGYQFMIGGLFMVGVGLAFGGNMNMANPGGVLDLVYLAFLSAIAYSLWSILLKYNPVSKVSVFNFMTPLFGVLLTTIFLPGEASRVETWQLICTLILISFGILLLNVRSKETSEKQKEQDENQIKT